MHGWLECCQTNANWSQLGQGNCPLCGAEIAPLRESSGAAGLEIVSAGEGALSVEVVVPVPNAFAYSHSAAHMLAVSKRVR